MCDGEEGAVVSGDSIIFREQDVVTGAAARLAGVEVIGIGVGRKDHFSDMIGDAVVGVVRALVEELVDAGVGGFSGRGLLRANFTEGVQEFFY